MLSRLYPSKVTMVKDTIKLMNPAKPAVKLKKETRSNKAPSIWFCEKNKIA